MPEPPAGRDPQRLDINRAERRMDAAERRVDVKARRMDAARRRVDAARRRMDAAERRMDAPRQRMDAATRDIDAPPRRIPESLPPNKQIPHPPPTAQDSPHEPSRDRRSGGRKVEKRVSNAHPPSLTGGVCQRNEPFCGPGVSPGRHRRNACSTFNEMSRVSTQSPIWVTRFKYS